MKTHSNKSNYKLLVLIDNTTESHKTLMDAVDFAKLINGSIDVFQVEPPTSVVKFENQIASMRAIDKKRYDREKKLSEVASKIKNREGVPVISNFTFGNVKNEIKNRIDFTQPDIIVVGKRKKKLFGLFGDQLTKYLMNNYNGSVLISSNESGLTTFNDQSIGFLNTIDGIENIALVNDIRHHYKKPFKVFRNSIIDNLDTKENETKNKAIVFEFNNKETDMVNFISKNNLSLLCVDKSASIKGELKNAIAKTIEKINVPVLVLNNNLT
ncbi:MAG: universal stress protein [Patiriisocius sp.]|uniref:universal stress protein n=1 Tax=Patiriisocius sp. TaxID=2822396 RepID=UPI003EF612C6